MQRSSSRDRQRFQSRHRQRSGSQIRPQFSNHTRHQLAFRGRTRSRSQSRQRFRSRSEERPRGQEDSRRRPVPQLRSHSSGRNRLNNRPRSRSDDRSLPVGRLTTGSGRRSRSRSSGYPRGRRVNTREPSSSTDTELSGSSSEDHEDRRGSGGPPRTGSIKGEARSLSSSSAVEGIYLEFCSFLFENATSRSLHLLFSLNT